MRTFHFSTEENGIFNYTGPVKFEALALVVRNVRIYSYLQSESTTQVVRFFSSFFRKSCRYLQSLLRIYFRLVENDFRYTPTETTRCTR